MPSNKPQTERNGVIFAILVDDLRRMSGEGMSDKEIAAVFGCSEPTIFNRRRDHGIPAGRKHAIKVHVDVAKIAELAAKGWSDGKIGTELGCSGDLIRKRRVDHGIPAGILGRGGRSGHPASDVSDDDFGHANLTAADAAFARLMGAKKFEDAPLKPSAGPIGKPLRNTPDISYSGCAAAMCAA